MRFIFLCIMLISLPLFSNANVDSYEQRFLKLLRQLKTEPWSLRWKYYERFLAIDSLSGSPIFKGNIRKGGLKDYSHYFKVYRKGNRAVIYEYYKDQLLKGSFLYKYIFNKSRKKKTAYLKIAVWYNPKGNRQRVNIYEHRKLKTVNYYNDFGILVRKVIYDFAGNHIADTDFIEEHVMLGVPEY